MKALGRSIAGTAAGLLLSSSIALADPIEYCPSNADNICYRVAVPESSAQADQGDMYFQIVAPATYSWVAMGTGRQMQGSNIFLMYQDGQGNVTLSPRIGPFHQMPTLDTSSTAAKLTVLAGSGLSADGKTITANFLCSNCQSWTGGGHISLTDSSCGFVGSWKQGPSLATTDKSATIFQHDDTAVFQLDLTKAVISDDSNPYSGGGGSSNSSSGGSSGSGSSSGGGSSGGGSGSSSGGVVVIEASASQPMLIVAHGLIMAITILVLYPLGSLLMPLFGKWYIHSTWQLFAYCVMWAGFGLGVTCAKQLGILFVDPSHHTIIGMTVISGLAIQPILGILHHRHYRRHQSRGVVSHLHIWWGRIFMLLGAVNGGLGLQLALAPNADIIAYSVVAGFMFLVYVVGKILLSMRNRRRYKENGSTSSPDASGRTA